ncbi:MAG: branched-chain amino acid ABC transporter permease, partial [Angelakisella sp.]
VTGGTGGIKGIPAPEIFGVELRSYGSYYYLILVVTILCIVLCRNLIHSRTGRAMRSIRESEIAAEAMGVDTTKYKIVAFVTSSFMAGIAGALYAHEVHFISPETVVGAESILAMMVVGGIGSIPGAIAGGIVLTVIPEFLRSFGDIRLVLYGVAIVAMIIYAPKGVGGLIEWVDGVLAGKIKPGKSKNIRRKETD